MKGTEVDPEVSFLRAYKDYIFRFNMLERNVAYALVHANPGPISEADYLRYHSMPFAEKLRRFAIFAEPIAARADVAEWLPLMQDCRSMRNRLVHGHWEFLWHLAEPIRYHVPAPEDEKGAFTLEAFLAELDKLNRAHNVLATVRQAIEQIAVRPS